MSRTHSVALLLAVFCALAGGRAEAVQRAHVSAAYGLDSNTAFNCDAARPCRFFQAATTVVDPNGEVVVLDSGGYGGVTITKSIALIAPSGVYAGISVFPGATGVTIASAGVNVVLRGITINSQGGDAGISMTAGASLSVENCVISNFSGNSQAGIFVNTAAKVSIIDTLVRDSYFGIQLRGGAVAEISKVRVVRVSTIGIFVGADTASTQTSAAISDTSVSGFGNGFGSCIVASTEGTSASTRVSVIRSSATLCTAGVLSTNFGAGTALITVSESIVTRNDTGLYQSGSGATLRSLGNNTLDQNGVNTQGTITTIPLS